MTTLHNSLPLFETRASAAGVIEGYGSVFGGIDSYGDTVVAGAFAESIRSAVPAMLWSHQADRPIGRWTELREDGRGLFVRGQVNMATAAGRDAYEHLREQDVTGLSIGYRVAPGGAEQRGDVRVLSKLELLEVSVVAMPADPAARVTAVKSQRPQSVRDLRQALQQLGYSRREAAALCEKGYAAIGESDPDTDPQLDALLGKLRAIHF